MFEGLFVFISVTALEDDKPVTLVEGDLPHKIKESEMIWTCSPGESIHVSFEIPFSWKADDIYTQRLRMIHWHLNNTF